MSHFEKLGDTIYTPDGPLTFIDNNANILYVAHLDTVMFSAKPRIKTRFKNTTITNCPQLDNRLGAWIGLHVLKNAGIKADILLTTNEEVGDSTAGHFTTTKQYNWIAEFDRAGSDVVMYNYETNYLKQLLNSFDYNVGYGSYTDIASLEDLGCKAFNFGTGYHQQHTKKCYANLSETFDSFRKFHELYRKCKDTHFEHTKTTWDHKPAYHWSNNTIGYSTSHLNTSNRKKRKNKKKKTSLQTIKNPWDPYESKNTKIDEITGELIELTPEEQQLIIKECHDEIREEALDTLAWDEYKSDYASLNEDKKSLCDETYEWMQNNQPRR